MPDGKIVLNSDEFMKKLRACSAKIEQRFRWTVMTAVHMAHEEILGRTPVNTGLTLNNYEWSMGSPAFSMRPAVEIGEYRGTNEMAVGEEPRRPANMVAPKASLDALSFSNPYQRYYLTNLGPAILDLEHGIAPTDPQYKKRSPSGMFAVSLLYIHQMLQNGGEMGIEHI